MQNTTKRGNKQRVLRHPVVNEEFIRVAARNVAVALLHGELAGFFSSERPTRLFEMVEEAVADVLRNMSKGAGYES